jgi:hypothetical protein
MLEDLIVEGDGVHWQRLDEEFLGVFLEGTVLHEDGLVEKLSVFVRDFDVKFRKVEVEVVLTGLWELNTGQSASEGEVLTERGCVLKFKLKVI